MDDKTLLFYANLARDHIESNTKFLKNGSGIPLLKEIDGFFETWVDADNLVSKVLKNSGSGDNSMMLFIIDLLWFPSLFSVAMNILVSALDSVLRTLRFLLEGLELGLVLDCSVEFRHLKLEEKCSRAVEFDPSCLLTYLDDLLDKDTLSELKVFYSRFSRKWVHAPTYAKQLLCDTLRKGELPSRALYFPPLHEREDEVDELVEIMSKFKKYAIVLIKEWEKSFRT